MTDTQIFHFAVKPGRHPVRLPSLSAHDRLPWVADGYDVVKMYAVLVGVGDHVRIWPDDENGLDVETIESMAGVVLDCVAKSVSKSGTNTD